jgi:NHLM bacteriocin system ABC transporter ATP-binding protein
MSLTSEGRPDSIGVLEGSGPPRLTEETPLDAAVQTVARACGITIPRGAPGGLDALAEAAGARVRRVRLNGRWWTRDCGPMIAYRGPENEPVAVVPAPRSWLRPHRPLIVAGSGAPSRLDAAMAAMLSPVAHVIHPPLPDRASGAAILRFAVRSTVAEGPTVLFAALAATLLAMLTPQAALLVLQYAVPAGDRTMLVEIAVALVAAGVAAALFDVAQAVATLRILSSSAATLQVAIWDRLLRQPAAFFRRFTAGDLRSRAESITQIRLLLNETSIGGLLGSAVSLLTLGLLFYYSVRLAFAAALIALIAALLTAASGYSMWRIVRPLQELDGQLSGLLVQLLAAVPKLQVAGAESRAFAQWSGLYRRRLLLDQQLRRRTDRVRLFGVVLWPSSMAWFLWLVAGGGASSMSVGAFVAFTAAFGLFLSGAIALGESTATILTIVTLWKRMDPILEAHPETRGGKLDPGTLAGDIRLDHVTFRYRSNGPLTLHDVSIHAAPGECIALVGPSGSGKSTIVNLLLRFETPMSGAVYYDGHDLDGLDVLAVRRQLGVVTQENRVLAGSLYDNIVCGSLLSMDDAWEAARAAGLDDDIRQMPMGMHTLVSEAGGNLSGGQRQRLLIARALVQKPRIVILDEATSALDNRTQALVTAGLNALKVTRLVVAHRLSTIRQADRIYVIDRGRVVQQGTFDDLMNQDGLFATLMRRQTAR